MTEQEHQRRRTAVWRFVAHGMNGNVPAFLDNLSALDWPGAFREVFAELVPMVWVSPEIRTAFMRAWRGNGDWSQVRPIGIGWRIGADLDGHPDLYAQGLKILTPPYDGREPPAVLYRGQSLAEHHQGRHGIWWTPYPHIAEWYARSEIRDHTGQRCIVAAFDPGPAIFSRLCNEEFLLNPTILDHVELVMTPPPYTGEQEHQDLGRTTLLDRVPHGYAREAVSEWKARTFGETTEGIAA